MLIEGPARGARGKQFLRHGEDDPRSYLEDGPHLRVELPSVLLKVERERRWRNVFVREPSSNALHDNALRRVLGADDTVRICTQVLRLSRFRARAEIASVSQPDAPDNHRVRTAIGTHGGDQVVVGVREALRGPTPRYRAFHHLGNAVSLRHYRAAGPGFCNTAFCWK